jgi:hypothetical protein
MQHAKEPNQKNSIKNETMQGANAHRRGVGACQGVLAWH